MRWFTMANVAPPRFIRNPAPGLALAQALEAAFAARRIERLPAVLQQLLNRLHRLS